MANEHHFKIKDAINYGVECAILIYNIDYWIEKNKANDKHFHKGQYWTYNSTKAFAKLFPYFSEHQISRYLKKLEDAEILLKDNFNQVQYDRTCWYSLSEKYYSQNAISENAKSISQKHKMELVELQNGFNEFAKPIPDNKLNSNQTDNNTNLKNYVHSQNLLNDVENEQEEKEKSCGKKEKEDEAIEVLEYLNQCTGKKFRPVESQLKFIKARLKEKGIDVQTLKQVIELKVFDWGQDVKMKEYLRPETLFNPTKFETYLTKARAIIENPQQFKNDVQQTINTARAKERPDSANNLQAIDNLFNKAHTGG